MAGHAHAEALCLTNVVLTTLTYDVSGQMRLHGLLSLLGGSGACYVVLHRGRKASSVNSGLASMSLYSTVAAVVSGGLLAGGVGGGSLFMLGFYEITSTCSARSAIVNLVVEANGGHHHIYFTCGFGSDSRELTTAKCLNSAPSQLTSLARV